MELHSRILLGTWATALADGIKGFEVQRYERIHYNVMKSIKPHTWIVVGPKKSPHIEAFAMVHDIRKHLTAEEMMEYVGRLDQDLQQQLLDYMDGGRRFDVMTFSRVVDVRAHGLTWTSLQNKLGVQKIPRNLGFPNVPLGTKAVKALEKIVSQGIVHEHLWPEPEGEAEIPPKQDGGAGEAPPQKRLRVS